MAEPPDCAPPQFLMIHVAAVCDCRIQTIWRVEFALNGGAPRKKAEPLNCAPDALESGKEGDGRD